ncbi:hypothetical protein [Sinomonas halotolerans]|uniref:Uncharacterized protein n=1 Tax=Sinomonas halotolerans TaxID=1644133 RepID=A0ABU9WWZ4_9MICC
MEWLVIAVSVCIAVGLGTWMALHEDVSTAGHGRHRVSPAYVRVRR